MADIKYLLREESSLTLLENGTAGDGGLDGGELGYTDEAGVLEFSMKKRAGGFARILSKARLALAAAAVNSGAANIGYFPTGGLVSTTVQEAIDELAAGAGGGGGGGTVLGSGTTGKLTKWLNSTTVQDSDFLTEAAGKLHFDGDGLANLYRVSGGKLGTDGDFQVNGALAASGILSGGDVDASSGTLYAGDAEILGDILAGSNIIMDAATSQIGPNDDASQVFLRGGSGTSSSNGAFIQLGGNSHGTVPGMLRLFSGNIAGAFIDFVGTSRLNGILKMLKETATPTAPSTADEVNVYMKGTLVVYQYNDAGTVRYKYLDLAGTGTTWTHSTTAP